MDLLIEQMEIDIENGDYDRVKEYGEVLKSLKAIFQEQYIEDYEEIFNELKRDAEDCSDFEAIKAETLWNTGDKYLAEDLAWSLVFA